MKVYIGLGKICRLLLNPLHYAVVALFILIISQPFAYADVEYQTKPGDQLGKILQAFNLSPLWGPKGYVAKTVALNEGIIKSNGDFVREQVLIFLPLNPAQVRAPAQAQTTEPKPLEEIKTSETPSEELHESKFLLGVNTAASYVRIDAKDKSNGSKATLASKLSPGVRVSGYHLINDTWSYGVSYRLQQLQFYKPKSRDLTQSESLLHEVGASLTWGYQNWFSASFSIFGSERVFPTTSSSSSLLLSSSIVPRAEISNRIRLLNTKSFQLGIGYGAGLLFPTAGDSFTAQMGSNWFGRIDTKHQISDHWGLSTGLRVDSSKQDTSEIQNTNLGLIFDFGISYLFSR